MNKFTIIIGFIFISIFWIFWLPGPRVATDYYLSSQQVVKDYTYPWAWRENISDGLGEYVVSTLWSHPIHLFFRLLIELNISVIWITKILFALILIIGFISINRLLVYLKIQGLPKFAGILFYLSNTFFLLLIDGGQLSLGLVYSFAPLALYTYFKHIDNFSLKNRLSFISSLLIISFLDLRFIFILFLLFFIHIIFKISILLDKERFIFLWQLTKTGVLALFVMVLAHAYWLIPSVFTHNFQLPTTFDRVSQVDLLSWSSISNSLFLYQPHWYKNIFGQISSVSFVFSLIPILAFSALFIKRKDQTVGFFVLIALIGIFLSKGSQDPFGFLYNWFFINIPGFSLFRDPVKFYLFIALSYSILIAISLEKFSEIKLRNRLLSSIFHAAPFLVIFYFLILMWPILFGKMTGLFSEPRYESEYLIQNQIFEKDGFFSRIVWIPNQSPLGYFSLNHPPMSAYKLVQKRPFAVGVKGTYETLNFLREASFSGELMDVAGIGYINYPYIDSKKGELSADSINYYYLFFNQLANLNWLSKVPDSKIPLLKVNKHQDRFFITSKVWLVVGSDNIYNDVTRNTGLALSKNALIFIEEYPGIGNIIENLEGAKIILNNKSELDLAATFIKKNNLIFPAKILDFSPDESGWWKRESSDLISWRAFLQDKHQIDNQDFDLGGGWAVAEGNKELIVRPKEIKNDSILLARVLESSKSGELSFYQSDILVGKIDTKKLGNNVKWFEVGKLFNRYDNIKIKASGDINVVNALAILDRTEWYQLQNQVKSLGGRIKAFDQVNTDKELAPTLRYEKINPTKYILNIEGLTDRAFVIFSQSFDPHWKINGQSAVSVYSLLNGFEVEKNGRYIIEFEVQKYVDFGLIISGFTLLAYFVFVIRYGRDK